MAPKSLEHLAVNEADLSETIKYVNNGHFKMCLRWRRLRSRRAGRCSIPAHVQIQARVLIQR